MLTPTEHDLQELFHVIPYDPIQAHEYYERTKKLKGRQRGAANGAVGRRRASSIDPRTGKTRPQIARDARAVQRKELTTRIAVLSQKLQRLEAKIQEMVAEEKREDRKGAAKKERAAKEASKPKTAAEKAEASRDSEKYRDKNQQKLKAKADGKADGSKKKPQSKAEKISQLKITATKARGQIAVAKQKLAAL